MDFLIEDWYFSLKTRVELFSSRERIEFTKKQNSNIDKIV